MIADAIRDAVTVEDKITQGSQHVPGWAGKGSHPTTKDARQRAFGILKALLETGCANIDCIAIIPKMDGGLQIEIDVTA